MKNVEFRSRVKFLPAYLTFLRKVRLFLGFSTKDCSLNATINYLTT